MSTILDALKKAKDTPPPKESVDAQREILSNNSHDYLATVPSSRDDTTRLLWVAVTGLAVSVVILLGIIVTMLVFGDTETHAPQQPVVIAPTPEATVSPTVSPTPALTPIPTQAQAAPPAIVHVHLPSMQTPQATPAPTATPSPTPIPTATPEIPVADLKAKIRSLKLQGILWDEKEPMALINGKTVSPGTTLADDELKVLRIEKDKVVLEGGGQTFELY